MMLTLSNVPLCQLQGHHGSLNGSSEDIHSAVTLPRNYRQSVISNEEVGLPSEISVYSMAGKDEGVYEQKRHNSKTFPRAEQVPKLSERYPQPPPPRPPSGVLERLQVTEHRPRPVSSLSSGYGSAVSNAVAELKEKAIYKAEVIKQYKFVSSPSSELVLEVNYCRSSSITVMTITE